MYKINGRFKRQSITGVQRVAVEMTSRLDFDVVDNPFGGVLGHLYEQLVLPFKLSSDDVLISFCNLGPVFRKNHVVYIHDVAVLEHPQWFSKSFAFLYRFMLPRIARNCKAIVTVSHYSKRRIIDVLDISPDKIHVIENGVSDDYASLSICAGKALLEFGLEEKKYILTVSSLDPRKNIKNVIKAWMKSDLLAQGYKLAFIGGNGGSFREVDVETDVSNVVFTGYVSDEYLQELYKNAAGFVYMSLYEGFGLPVLEAMKSEIPVLASNTTSLAEIASEHCLSCSPLELSEITKCMNALPSIEKKTISEAREYADTFSWDLAVNRLTRLLKGLKE
jgi:glycosyltransferase involved in cell wall biosynthesis